MMQPVPLKIALALLLLANALLFFTRGEYNDSFDSLAWIVLMVLYEIETGNLPALKASAPPFRWIRNLAVAIVVIAELSYLLEGAWLDGLYSLLWLLVVVLFEIESRYPAEVATHPRLFRTAGLALALGMIGVIIAWLLEGSYFNAYDGVIWSLAFLIIDLDLVASALDQSARQKTPLQRPSTLGSR
jgi:hypothetical protein